MASEFPRVLFVTAAAFNHQTGGGVTFSNLFAGWPKDRLATVTDDPVPVSRDVCENFYFLSKAERSYQWPLNYLDRRQNLSENPTSSARKSTSVIRKIIKRIVGSAGLPDAGHLTPKLAEWIATFNPDVIYTILGTLGYMDLIEQIGARFQIPVVVHLMDDGVTDPLRPGIFGGYIRRAYKKKFLGILAKARTRLAICEWMADEYEKRYGYKFGHSQNPVDISRWSSFAKTSVQAHNPFKIIFSGSVLPFAQRQALLECAKAVKELLGDGLSVELHIYTPLSLLGKDDQSQIPGPGVFLHGALEDDEAFFRTLGQADLLLLPVNFDDLSVHYIRLSMPTRVPAYLASGTPIFLYGPKQIAQVEYARRDKWAYVLSEEGIPKIKEAIIKLANDQELREQLMKTSKKVAKTNHDAPKVRQEFRRALSGV